MDIIVSAVIAVVLLLIMVVIGQVLVMWMQYRRAKAKGKKAAKKILSAVVARVRLANLTRWITHN